MDVETSEVKTISKRAMIKLLTQVMIKSVVQCASEIGVSRQYLSGVVNGKRELTLWLVERIEELYGPI